MRQFRSTLTRLITKMEDKFPSDGDILEYPGINKKMIIDATKLAYDLSKEIEPFDDDSRFEIITLKRFLSDTNRTLNEFIDNIERSSAKKKFNEFLDILSQLIEKTKVTYFIVTKNAIRDDQELAILKEKIDYFTNELSKLIDLKTKASEDLTNITATIESIESLHSSAQEKNSELATWSENAEKYYSSLEEVYNKIEGWDEEILTIKTRYDEMLKEHSAMNKRVAILSGNLDGYVIQSEEASKTLRENQKENEKLLEETRETLGNANRVGMARSFKERKVELGIPQTTWMIIFVLAVLGILSVSILVVLPAITKETVDWIQVLFKVVIVFPLIWLGWFAAKQYGYTVRIREDYAFKYASSMAYEGHKKATREVDEELEQVLLEFTLYNMAQNPIRLYSKKDRETPVQEFCDSLLEKLPNFKRITAKTPDGTMIKVDSTETE